MTVSALEAAGLTRMDDGEIRSFLSNRRVGVLGLPTDDGPYMIPLSFGYDEERTLYFTFVGGPSSRKQTLAEQADTACVLAYAVESLFHWESVRLTGTIDAVPESEWGNLAAVLDSAWRPELFEAAVEAGDIAVYRFHVDEQEGVRHAGLPPGFEPE
jgi:nitroimidazol reductase NimA-like FMN-containing flavoprotein (pyridoxamine 5'-phosphate oxidase superfamily)